MKVLLEKQIAYFEQSATPEYWDKRWKNAGIDIFHRIKSGLPHHLNKILGKYIPVGSKVLEAGCGMGNIVYGLAKAGRICTGVDYAPEIIRAIKEIELHLDVHCADIRRLPFEDSSFDACISMGVIEHYLDGYLPIIKEMNRILKKTGIVIISFPAMNILRNIKKLLGCYPKLHIENSSKINLEFYQFALDWKKVVMDIQKLGYSLEEVLWYEAWLGIADEVPGVC